ncbi:uncharacterized protein LOC113318700 isoform X3 [Papaver somniferum]|uniref:uncharacterized protein LOC113318700 isoform X3 n=1 Tax=Papaver somniferum TaxID=3469 RepID=UPI000E703E6F|nr:uncharacterized protein LOC113318700 isoform X3 [Papaver somniferum]
MKKLIKRHKPTIVALLETRVLASHAAGIVGRLGFSKSIVIDPEGFSGGMCLLWDPEEVDIQDTKESRWVIHAVVTAKFKSPWILSSIYGSTNKVTRKRIWDELEAIAEFGKTGHMVMGDLNTIGARNEKAGGKEPSANQLQELKDVMDQCGLIDLGANGPKFTWNNKRPGLANIKERLDHVLANEEWCKSFKNAQKSRIDWLKDGDLNTKIFHTSTLVRRRRNSINLLKDNAGFAKHVYQNGSNVAEVWAARDGSSCYATWDQKARG